MGGAGNGSRGWCRWRLCGSVGLPAAGVAGQFLVGSSTHPFVSKMPPPAAPSPTPGPLLRRRGPAFASRRSAPARRRALLRGAPRWSLSSPPASSPQRATSAISASTSCSRWVAIGWKSQVETAGRRRHAGGRQARSYSGLWGGRGGSKGEGEAPPEAPHRGMGSDASAAWLDIVAEVRTASTCGRPDVEVAPAASPGGAAKPQWQEPAVRAAARLAFVDGFVLKHARLHTALLKATKARGPKWREVPPGTARATAISALRGCQDVLRKVRHLLAVSAPTASYAQPGATSKRRARDMSRFGSAPYMCRGGCRKAPHAVPDSWWVAERPR